MQLGCNEGCEIGWADGSLEGCVVGWLEGCVLGCPVGISVDGCDDGFADG